MNRRYSDAVLLGLLLFVPAVSFAQDTKVLANAYSAGNSLLGKGEYDKAIAAFSDAIHVDPNQARAYYGRGLALGATRKFDEAIADYSEAIRLDPTLAPAYQSRGKAHLEKRNADQALADCNTAIRLDPTLPLAYVLSLIHI